MVSINSKHLSFFLAIALLALSLEASAKPPSERLVRLLPRELGGFQLVAEARLSDGIAREGLLGPQAAGQKLEAERHYFTAEAEYRSGTSRFLVEVVRFPQDSDAY